MPLRFVSGGVNHFLFPTVPFLLKRATQNSRAVLEAPLAMLPVVPHSARTIHRLASRMMSSRRNAVLTVFRHIAAVGMQPAWFPLFSMMWATKLHQSRGGKFVTMLLHSSELCPGATPGFQNERAVERLVRRMGAYLTWLTRTGRVEGMTLSCLTDSTTYFDYPDIQLTTGNERSPR